jgi:hypothetical protein
MRGSPPRRPKSLKHGRVAAVVAASDEQLGGARLGDLEESLAELRSILSEIVEAWERREALEAEYPLEQRRRPVAHSAAGPVLPTGLADETALDEARDRGVGSDAADSRDVGT